jgi:hypothetical protein
VSLGRIFGPKREEVQRSSKLHNEEFHNLFSSSLNIGNQIKDEMDNVYSVHGKIRIAYKILGGKAEGK